MAVIETKKYQINEVANQQGDLRVLHPETEPAAVKMTANSPSAGGSIAFGDIWGNNDTLQAALETIVYYLGTHEDALEVMARYSDLFSDTSHTTLKTSILPSFVDDVLEYNNLASFPVSGEAGKIYVAKDTNLTYRWSGSAYVEISSSLAIGTTSSTAFAGDRGAALEALVGDRANLIANPDNLVTYTTLVDAINYLLTKLHQVDGDVSNLDDDVNDVDFKVDDLVSDLSSGDASVGIGCLPNSGVITEQGVTAKTCSAVTVNAKGLVIAGGQMIAVGGSSAPANLAVGGLWFKEV